MLRLVDDKIDGIFIHQISNLEKATKIFNETIHCCNNRKYQIKNQLEKLYNESRKILNTFIVSDLTDVIIGKYLNLNDSDHYSFRIFNHSSKITHSALNFKFLRSCIKNQWDWIPECSYVLILDPGEFITKWETDFTLTELGYIVPNNNCFGFEGLRLLKISENWKFNSWHGAWRIACVGEENDVYFYLLKEPEFPLLDEISISS